MKLEDASSRKIILATQTLLATTVDDYANSTLVKSARRRAVFSKMMLCKTP